MEELLVSKEEFEKLSIEELVDAKLELMEIEADIEEILDMAETQ